MSGVQAVGTGGKVETKTKAATVASGVVSFVLLVILGALDQDQILEHVPDVLTSTVTAAFVAATTFLRGYAVAHVPGKLSQSAKEALERYRAR